MKQVLKKPLISEKNTRLNGLAQYVFEVHVDANKFEVLQAVASRFGVQVEKVRTLNQRGKHKVLGRNIGKKPNFKKAIVTLKKGQKIDLFEGNAS
ncbi:MAG: 50S ribosomal protein L23 [Deltaproteobacteria bacterium]|nr:50S ribosomal protein L23 [Deltaproteobacteria bacterium]